MRSTVGQWMSWGLRCASPDQPLLAALDGLDQASIHHLAIVEGEALRGVLVAEGGLLTLARDPARRARLEGLRVRDAMTPAPLPTVPPEVRLRDAAQCMLASGATCLVVQEANGPLVGIITARDLLSALVAGGSVRHPED